MQPMQKMSRTKWPLANFQQATNATHATEESRTELIPRPTVCKSFFRINRNLAEAMKSTHPTAKSFDIFKIMVQTFSKEVLHRNRNIRPNSPEWSGFVEQLLLHDPKLAKYENVWPVEYYVHTLRRKWVRASTTKCKNIEMTQATMLSSSGSPSKAPSKALLSWARKRSPSPVPTVLFPATQPPCTLAKMFNRAKRFSASGRDTPSTSSTVPMPRTSQFSQSASAVQGPSQSSSAASLSQTNRLSTSGLSEHALSQTSSTSSPPKGTQFLPGVMPEQRLSRTPSTAFISGASHPSPAPPIGPFNKNPILVSCPLCQPLMTIQASRHPSSTGRISAFAETDDDVLRALALIGIVFDQHLDIILCIDSSIFEQLISTGSANVLKASMKYRILFLLEQAKEKRNPSNQMSLDGSETTDIIPVPCLLHPLVDTSAMTGGLQSLLRIFGIEELIAAVALMGLLTLEDFTHFCNLSESARTTMIKNLRIQLNHFQTFMLNRAFQVNAIV